MSHGCRTESSPSLAASAQLRSRKATPDGEVADQYLDSALQAAKALITPG
jgi:hypothetical protein